MELCLILSVILLVLVTGLILTRSIPSDTSNTTMSSQANTAAKISVIIPARNEAENLPLLLQSLQNNSSYIEEIIVVDDDSTDATPDVAREWDATVVAAEPLPEGWTGKTWACWQGAQAANGAIFLFLDADTRFVTGGFSRLSESYLQSKGVLSLMPYHRTGSFCEELSVFGNLVTALGVFPINSFKWRSTSDRLFGPMLMLSREHYYQVGGHEAVKATVLENFSLGHLFANAGIALNRASGKNIFEYRMYREGMSALIQGWSKILHKGASKTPLPNLWIVSIWLTGLMTVAVMPWMFLLMDGWQLATLVGFTGYAIVALQLNGLIKKVGTFSFLTAAIYPVFLVFYFYLFFRSTKLSKNHQETVWKGREVPQVHEHTRR